MSKGIVYFISDSDGSMKIGVTSNIEKRMKALQTGNAKPLELVHYVTTFSMKDAYELEAALHRKLKNHHINLEWYEEKAVMKLLRKRTVKVEGLRFKGMGIKQRKREILIAVSAFVLAFILVRFGLVVMAL